MYIYIYICVYIYIHIYIYNIYINILFSFLIALKAVHIKFPCKVCSLEVNNNDHSIRCDSCDKKNHINCVYINEEKHKKLKINPLP